MDLNIVNVSGHFVRDPVIRRSEMGITVGWFTLQSDYCYEDHEGARCEDTAFVTCKAVGPFADALARRRRGDFIYVTGRLRTETFRRGRNWQSGLMVIVDSLETRVSSRTLA